MPNGPLWRVGRVVGVLVVVVVAVLFLVSRLPDLNPFHEEEIDRSQPALLQSVKDLSQYHAAEGNFQVVVDIEHDVAWVPDVIALVDELPKTGVGRDVLPLGAAGAGLIAAGVAGLWWSQRRPERREA